MDMLGTDLSRPKHGSREFWTFLLKHRIICMQVTTNLGSVKTFKTTLLPTAATVSFHACADILDVVKQTECAPFENRLGSSR